MADLRIAIIGYGLAGRVFHAPLIALTDGLRISAIVTADPRRRELAADEHPDARVVTTVEEALDGCDAVVVATPNDSHVSLATAAIDRGLPVVVDKPLAIDADAAAALIAHAERAGVLLTVFHNRRWDSDQLLLSRLLGGEALGTVVRHESRIERWRPEADAAAWRETTTSAEGGGLLLDLGSHLVDQALHHFGPARSVYAELDARRGSPGEDDAFLAIRHAGGVISHLHASALVAAPGPRLRVLGTEAALLVTGDDTQEDRLRARGTAAVDRPAHGHARLVAGERSVPLTPPPGDWPAFYAGVRDALRGEGPPPVDAADALAGLRILDAARASARQGSVIALA